MNRPQQLISFLIMLCFSLTAYAGGGITHMYIAKESIKLVSDTKLRHLLLDNLDAYLVGANYPDSGFVAGTHYGEDSHWDPFIFTFTDYIKETYRHPEIENPKLVAFLFGCATHSVSDIILHWTFCHALQKQGFKQQIKPDNYIESRNYCIIYSPPDRFIPRIRNFPCGS